MKTILTMITIVLMAEGVAQAQAFNPDFLECAVFISSPTSHGVRTGTGFLVWRALGGKRGQVFLLTNKHLLPSEGTQQSITIRVAKRDNNVQQVDIPIVGSDGKYVSTVIRHSIEGVDVSAVNITNEILRYDVPGKWLDYNLFVTPDKLVKEKISAGDEVFILGYPSAIYDPHSVTPITRIGIIASLPSKGFSFNAELKASFGFPDHLNGFLIDANIYPGSSGSLVILKQQPETINSDGDVEFDVASKRRPYLLGIVSASLPIDDTALGSRVRMGLGFVQSADVIRQTIEQSARSGPTIPERGVVSNIALSENTPGELSLWEPISHRWVSWKVGNGLPTGRCLSGSLYSRIDGGTNSTLYVCENSAWIAK